MIGSSAPEPSRFIAFVFQSDENGKAATSAAAHHFVKTCKPLGSLLSVALSCIASKSNIIIRIFMPFIHVGSIALSVYGGQFAYMGAISLFVVWGSVPFTDKHWVHRLSVFRGAVTDIVGASFLGYKVIKCIYLFVF